MKTYDSQQRSVQRQVPTDNNQHPLRTGTYDSPFEDKRPVALQMKRLREMAGQYVDSQQTVVADHGAFNGVVQRIKKEALVVGRSYIYKGKAVFYLGIKTGKYAFGATPTSAMPTKLTEEQLTDVSEGSGSEQQSEKTEPKKEIEDIRMEASVGKTGLKQNQIKPKSREEARLKAEQDTGGWFVDRPVNTQQKIVFLNNVITRARSIIPTAFNRRTELEPGVVDFTNTALRCKDKLIGQYANHLGEADIPVHNKYIHPAALERIYQIVRDTAPIKAQEEGFSIAGVCKDFASICYGLILQNNVGDMYHPELSFMSGHVYVTVTIDGTVYAIDAWLNGQVVTQPEHEEAVSRSHKGILSYDPKTYTRTQLEEFEKSKPTDEIEHVRKFRMETDTDKKRRTKDQESFNQSLVISYQNAERARLIWYQNEDLYIQEAKDEWAEGKTGHVNRGKE